LTNMKLKTGASENKGASFLEGRGKQHNNMS
jgi:hypothetical protein